MTTETTEDADATVNVTTDGITDVDAALEITAVSGSSSYYYAAVVSAMADADAETLDVMTAVSGLFSC